MAGRKQPLKNATSYANKLKELGCKNIETYRCEVSGEINNKTIEIFNSYITVSDTDSNAEITSLFRYSNDQKHITKKVLKFLLDNNGDFTMDKEGNVIDDNITKQVVLKAEASAEMRPFSYNGKVIMASSKEDAIKQVVTAAKGHHKKKIGFGPGSGPDMNFDSFFKSIGFKKNKKWGDLVLNKVIMSQEDFFNDDGFYLAFDDDEGDYNTEYEFNSRNLVDVAIERGLTDKEAEKVVKDFAETIKRAIKKNVGKLKKVKSARELRAITNTFPELKVKPNKALLELKKKIESNKSLLWHAIDDIEHERDYKENIKKVINNLQKLL